LRGRLGGDAALARIEAARERRELLEAVHRNPGVRSLAANPLLLTILVVMKRQGVTLPERRASLYQTYVETLLQSWNLVRSLAGRSSSDLDLVETLKVLAPLALWMHETSPGVGLVKEWDLQPGAGADLPRAQEWRSREGNAGGSWRMCGSTRRCSLTAAGGSTASSI